LFGIFSDAIFRAATGKASLSTKVKDFEPALLHVWAEMIAIQARVVISHTTASTHLIG